MTSITWSNGWQPISDEAYQVRLAEELRREIENNDKHILFDRSVEFVAQWIGSREKDFIVRDANGSYFAVHLTYNLEHDPSWPWTSVIGNQSKLQEFVNREEMLE